MEVFGSVPPPAVKAEDIAPDAPAGRLQPRPIEIKAIAHHRRRGPPLQRATQWILHQLHLGGSTGRAA